MKLYQRPQQDDLDACPYLPDREKQYLYFYADELDSSEISYLLRAGWRKFGMYYFRPQCPGCQACIPIRVLTSKLLPSRSQRRILRKNEDIEVRFNPLQYTAAAFELYRDHSEIRFGMPVTEQGFIDSFYAPSCPALQSEYYLNGELIALGILDRGEDCLSSVYFVYNTAWQARGLGHFSVFRESEFAASQGLAYYYLGYWIQGCKSMAYKNRFLPAEVLDWGTGKWQLLPEDVSA